MNPARTVKNVNKFKVNDIYIITCEKVELMMNNTLNAD
jgi:hypothetical protein